MKNLAFILLLFGSGCVVHRLTRFQNDEPSVRDRMMTDVRVLASDSLGGRPSGSEFERKSASYVALRLEEAGLRPIELPFEIPQDSTAPLQCRSIAAFLDHHADSTILITAHYDHLGLGSGKSLEIRKTGIHPGADDNASGVAMLLELARALQGRQIHRYNYCFVALAGHELGLFGAKDLVQQSFFKNLKLKYCLNLDMVGRLNPSTRTVRLSYCGKFSSLQNLRPQMETMGLYVLLEQDGSLNDFSVFCTAGLPAFSITTGIHEDYHRMGDLASKINVEVMQAILNACLKILP